MSEQEGKLREQRERAQRAQHELLETRFFAKTCADKIADLERNLQQTTATLGQLEEALAHSRSELAGMSDRTITMQDGVLV